MKMENKENGENKESRENEESRKDKQDKKDKKEELVRRIKKRIRQEDAISPKSRLTIIDDGSTKAEATIKLCSEVAQSLHCKTKIEKCGKMVCEKVCAESLRKIIESREGREETIIIPWTAEDEIELFFAEKGKTELLGYAIRTKAEKTTVIKLLAVASDEDIEEITGRKSGRSEKWKIINQIFEKNAGLKLSFVSGISKMSQLSAAEKRSIKKVERNRMEVDRKNTKK